MQLNKHIQIHIVAFTIFCYIIPQQALATDQKSTNNLEQIIKESEGVKKLIELKNLRPTIIMQQEEMRNKNQQQRQQFQQEMDLKRREIIQEVEQKIKEKNELSQASREAFLKNMQIIRDEKKKNILEKVDGMFNEINKKQTRAMSVALNKLSDIMDQMAEKADAAEAAGADTEAFDTAMALAVEAMEEADAAITVQAAKEYVITITTEDTLRESVQKTKSELMSDLATVRDLVKQAKDLLKLAARELVRIQTQSN